MKTKWLAKTHSTVLWACSGCKKKKSLNNEYPMKDAIKMIFIQMNKWDACLSEAFFSEE